MIIITSIRKTAKCWLLNNQTEIPYYDISPNTVGVFRGLTLNHDKKGYPLFLEFPESQSSELATYINEAFAYMKSMYDKKPGRHIFELLHKNGIRYAATADNSIGDEEVSEFLNKIISNIDTYNIYVQLVCDAPMDQSKNIETRKIIKKMAESIDNMPAFKQNPYKYCRASSVKLLDMYSVNYQVPQIERILGSAMFHLRNHYENDGHVCFPVKQLMKEMIYQTLHQDMKDTSFIETTLLTNLQSMDEFEIITSHDGNDYIYMKEVYNQEMFIAQKLKALRHSNAYSFDVATVASLIDKYQESSEKILTDQQRQCVLDIFTTTDILVVTGCPGTGKSLVTSAIKYVHQHLRNVDSIIFSAPTGIAANRLNDGKGMTLHRALKVTKNPKGDGYVFQVNAKTPFDADLLLVDEVSMMDIDITYSTLLAVRPGLIKVVLLGDHKQLPSVGAGVILRHIIESKAIPVIKLTKIFRQKGNHPIIGLAKSIVNGKMPLPEQLNNDKVVYIKLTNPENIYKRMLRIFKELDGKCQIIFPTKKITTVGSIEGNKVIAANMRSFDEANFRTFYAGDKVVCTRNIVTSGQDDKSAFNGDIGIVESFDVRKKQVTFQTFTNKKVTVDADHIEFGWCITCNKAQGSEYDHVIVVLHESQGVMLNRELLYTAVTRAKNKLFIIGTDDTIHKAVTTPAPKRYSFLSSFLVDE
jgi:exodeoxyribonuclease V alpha subunit